MATGFGVPFIAFGQVLRILSARLEPLGDVYFRPMSPEIIAILAVAIALAGLILRQGHQLGQSVAGLDRRLTSEIQQLDRRLTSEIQQLDRRLTAEIQQLDQRLTAEVSAQRDEIAALRDGQVQLGERMARLEGMIETAFRLTPPEAA